MAQKCLSTGVFALKSTFLAATYSTINFRYLMFLCTGSISSPLIRYRCNYGFSWSNMSTSNYSKSS